VTLAATRRLYGMQDENSERFGKMCLMARRMVERGVRYVQLRMTMFFRPVNGYNLRGEAL